MKDIDPVAEEWMLQYRYFFSAMNDAAITLKQGKTEPSGLIKGAEEALAVFRKEMDGILLRIEKTYFLKIDPCLFDRHVNLLKEGRYDSLIELASYSENVLDKRMEMNEIYEGMKVLSPF